jgi:hypothetical protein
MLDTAGVVCASAACGVLVWSGLDRLAHQRSYREIVTLQRLLPVPLVAPIVLSQGIGEVLVGAAGILSFTWEESHPSLGFVAFLSATLIYAVYSAYAAYLVKGRPGAPCACSRSSDPATVWVVIRALLLAIAAVTAAAAEPGSAWPNLSGAGRLIAVIQSLGLGVVIWNLPASLAAPWASKALPHSRAVVR